jgi:hypothetical protein
MRGVQVLCKMPRAMLLELLFESGFTCVYFQPAALSLVKESCCCVNTFVWCMKLLNA